MSSEQRLREWVGRLETEGRGYEDYERYLTYKLNKIESMLIEANKKLAEFIESAFHRQLITNEGGYNSASFRDIVEAQNLLSEAIALKNKKT